jgi:hypothetical protein
MQPSKQEEHALVELIDVILDKGIVIQADIIITVAEVPLLGVSLRAVLAGMAAMSEYGLFEDWDTEMRYSL